MPNYIFFSDSYDGYKNLAADEWFLDHVKEGELILYFYVNANAVIIGKNQNPYKECDLDRMKKDGVQLVRRPSGGGAVYHDSGNLNFSFNAYADRFDKEKQHRFILETVRALGVPCDFSGRNDLLADGRKFSGNAYCSRKNRRQHHGTLLVSSDLEKLSMYLTPDPRKIRSKGVDSVRSRVCNLDFFVPGLSTAQMKEVIPDAFKKVYGEYRPYVLDERANEEICVYEEKHRSAEWLFGTVPDFNYEIDLRCSFGGIEILLTVDHGAVVSSKTYSDANDAALPEKIDRALKGSPFSPASIARALEKEGGEECEELARRIRFEEF